MTRLLLNYFERRVIALECKAVKTTPRVQVAITIHFTNKGCMMDIYVVAKKAMQLARAQGAVPKYLIINNEPVATNELLSNQAVRAIESLACLHR